MIQVEEAFNEAVRLNKYLADAGVCSRREADRRIEEGRVKVNGVTATMGMKVTDACEVMVDGKPVHPEQEDILIAFNKPVGIECTSNRDVEGNIIDYLGFEKRIYPIGRLDKNSEGLILLTNNGELANHIMKAANYHEKEYVVKVNKPITDDFIKKMSKGVHIKDTRNGEVILDAVTRECSVKKIDKDVFNIILTQGLNRQIRRMCKELGYKVISLKRIRIMNIKLEKLPLGQYRRVRDEEYRQIKEGI